MQCHELSPPRSYIFFSKVRIRDKKYRKEHVLNSKKNTLSLLSNLRESLASNSTVVMPLSHFGEFDGDSTANQFAAQSP